MKHILIGGDGFVGRVLAADLLQMGEEVVVADVNKGDVPHYASARHIQCDILDRAQIAALPIEADDLVYNLSAKMLDPIAKRADRYDFFWPVNFHGVENILSVLDERGVSSLVHFTTDMIYGHTKTVPMTEDHPAVPLGEYGESKLATESLCDQYRQKGMNISIFRPRLIIGPGRLGILVKLFKLVDLNLPVPMIGSGRNPYQFISVFDCASACVAAWKAGFPNSAYNLGSKNPPSVRVLLKRLCDEANSKSILLPTPAPLVKAMLTALDYLNVPLMDPEQYLIADEYCLLDTSLAEKELGWVPQYSDDDMLIAAYRQYREQKEGRAGPANAAHSGAGRPTQSMTK